MSSIDILKSKYKPYRYTINKSVTIVESLSGKFVIKKQNKDLFTLFNYLESRGFNGFPKIIYNFENKENVFEYLDDIYMPKEQKLIMIADTLASLHNKTVYYKSVSMDDYKEIKEAVLENISYLNVFYEGLFLKFLKDEYLSPSAYLFVRNYYKIKECLSFCENQIDLWYDSVSDKTKARVSVVNNNIEMNHFFVDNNKESFASWDNYVIDTPILDIVHFYQKEYLNYDFDVFLDEYFKEFSLLESEKKLLFILLSIPNTFELGESEFKNTLIIRKNIDYVYKTENLLKPYFENET